MCIGKENDYGYVLVKGFQKTWIDSALKEAVENKKVKRTGHCVQVVDVYETVKAYAEANQLKFESMSDAPFILVTMQKEGYYFPNRKKQAEMLRMRCVELGSGSDFDREMQEWDFNLGLTGSTNNFVFKD